MYGRLINTVQLFVCVFNVGICEYRIQEDKRFVRQHKWSDNYDPIKVLERFQPR